MSAAVMMPWRLSWRTDPVARALADRHYTRQSPGAADFMPPGRCVVLRTECGRAVWGTSWPFAEYVKHAWAGAWMCSIFRNENSGLLSSELIRAAVAATRAVYGVPPDLGMVTFVQPAKTARRRSRRSPPGKCFIAAGFVHVGETVGGLTALQLLPDAMPAPEPPIGWQASLIA